jgi:hypothetical protein
MQQFETQTQRHLQKAMQTFHNTIQHCEYLYHSTYHKNSLTPPPFIEVLFQARKVSYHVFVF